MTRHEPLVACGRGTATAATVVRQCRDTHRVRGSTEAVAGTGPLGVDTMDTGRGGHTRHHGRAREHTEAVAGTGSLGVDTMDTGRGGHTRHHGRAREHTEAVA